MNTERFQSCFLNWLVRYKIANKLFLFGIGRKLVENVI